METAREHAAAPKPGPEAKRTWLRPGNVLCALTLLAAPPMLLWAFYHPAGVTRIAPPAASPPGRWVYLEGANNTRDLGGYPTRDGRTVRWKTVYRSGRLSGLTSAGGRAFCELGVRRVIDLRDRMFCSPLFGGDAYDVFRCAKVSLLPVTAAVDVSGSPYVRNVRENSESYRKAFELIADPGNLPVLVHCQVGKDRTGIFSALLLTLLGVDRETVMEDFVLSIYVEGPVSRTRMNELLDDVERCGGIESYLEGIGVSRATQQRIRELLLE